MEHGRIKHNARHAVVVICASMVESTRTVNNVVVVVFAIMVDGRNYVQHAMVVVFASMVGRRKYVNNVVVVVSASMVGGSNIALLVMVHLYVKLMRIHIVQDAEHLETTD